MEKIGMSAPPPPPGGFVWRLISKSSLGSLRSGGNDVLRLGEGGGGLFHANPTKSLFSQTVSVVSLESFAVLCCAML